MFAGMQVHFYYRCEFMRKVERARTRSDLQRGLCDQLDSYDAPVSPLTDPLTPGVAGAAWHPVVYALWDQKVRFSSADSKVARGNSVQSQRDAVIPSSRGLVLDSTRTSRRIWNNWQDVSQGSCRYIRRQSRKLTGGCRGRFLSALHARHKFYRHLGSAGGGILRDLPRFFRNFGKSIKHLLCSTTCRPETVCATAWCESSVAVLRSCLVRSARCG